MVDKWSEDLRMDPPARAPLGTVRAIIAIERQNLIQAANLLCQNATDPTAAAYWRDIVAGHADILDRATEYLVRAWQRPVARRAVVVGAPGDEAARLADR